MYALKSLAFAALLAATLLFSQTSAHALTARQYAAQGYGHYTSSKGHSHGWTHYRAYRRHQWHHRHR